MSPLQGFLIGIRLSSAAWEAHASQARALAVRRSTRPVNAGLALLTPLTDRYEARG
jgi:hypothetical protein